MKNVLVVGFIVLACSAVDTRDVFAGCPVWDCDDWYSSFPLYAWVHDFDYVGDEQEFHCNGEPEGHGTCHEESMEGDCADHGECHPNFAIGDVDDILAGGNLVRLVDLLKDEKTGLVAIEGGVGLKSSCSEKIIAAFPIDDRALQTMHIIAGIDLPGRPGNGTAFVGDVLVFGPNARIRPAQYELPTDGRLPSGTDAPGS